jgi:phage terminase large subunit-like protein
VKPDSRTIARAKAIAKRDRWPARMVRTEADAQAVLDHGCYFDPEAAQRFLRFAESFCRHSKGEWGGLPFTAMPWQRDRWFGPLFGWKRADDTRRYRRGGVWIPKKNTKTTSATVISLYLLIADKEPGAEVYSAANDRDQAGMIYREAAAMVKQSPELASVLNPIDSRRRIVYEAANAFYQALSADVPTKEGLNSHAVVIDELHALKVRALWSTLAYGGSARRQPLLLSISTAGIYDPASIGWEQYQYAKHVLDGTREDWSFFALVYEAAVDAGTNDTWKKPSVWKAANPAYGVTVKADTLREHCTEATDSLEKENDFLRYHLNIWVQQATRAIKLDVWDENHKHPIPSEQLKDSRAYYGGVDLGGIDDLSAWVMATTCDDDPEAVDIRARFWLPEDTIATNSKHHNAPLYRQWAREGVLSLTPGNVTDERFIQAAIEKDAQQYRLINSRIDRLFQANRLAIELNEHGVVMAAMGQGFLSMAAPTKKFLELVTGRRFHHGANPILRWMADNVVVRRDPAGNMKFDKERSPQKIDGLIASVMAVAGWMAQEAAPEPPKYEMLILGGRR